MKKLLTLILLVGAFGAGYHMGHRPGSADLQPFVRGCAAKAVALVRNAVAYVENAAEKDSPEKALTATKDSAQNQSARKQGDVAAEPIDESKAAAAVLSSIGVSPEGQLYAQAPEGKRRR